MADSRMRKRKKTPRLVDSVAPRNSFARRAFGWLVMLGLLGAAAGVAGVAGLFLYYGSDPDLPRIDHITDYRPRVVSRVVDRDGELLGEIFEERRTLVPFARISPFMQHAIVDAEDAQFFEHKGLNYWGMLRALINNLRPGAHLQGASTITQQLVKTYLLKTNERTIKRKVQEAILARRLEAALTKDEILYLYLNQIYFGHQRYGVEEAARFFFGKSISDVTAGEAAVLASLPKGPEDISPLKHPERAKERQCYVLRRMVEQHHLEQAEAERICKAPIQLVKAPATSGSAPEFVDEARRQLVARFGDQQLPFLGVTVKTTCDSRVQKLARESLERQLENLDERQKYRAPLKHLKSTTPQTIKAVLLERAVSRLHSLIPHATKPQKTKWIEDHEKALLAGRVAEVVVTDVEIKAPTHGLYVSNGVDVAFVPEQAHDRYNPKQLPLEKRFAEGDLITVRVEPTLGKTSADGIKPGLPIAVEEFGPQAAAVVIDPVTREVRAMVGGYGFHAGGFSRATMAHRQPGSAFKPFLYATAFMSGKYTLASVLNDSPQIFEQAGFEDWKVKNAESHEFLGPVRLRTALAKSLNTVAAQVVFDLKPAPVAETAHSAGIESKLDETPALGLGASVVTLEELTNAYATFAAQGRKAAPVKFLAVGNEPMSHDEPLQALSPEVSFLVTSMMQSVIEEGTGASARGKLKRPAAGKTGTTSSERDAWFVGYTPDLVAGVWVGFDDMRDLGHGEQGARSALPIWIDIMVGTLKGVPPSPFAQPAGIEVHKIDPASGLLAVPGAANAMDEFFLPGSAPTTTAAPAGEPNPDDFLTQ